MGQTSITSNPKEYLVKTYAGVLGKVIGVYLGRPIEGWTHERILSKLGPINYYLNEKFDLPLVVPDDDISATFAFARAASDHLCIDSLKIGRYWQDTVIKGKSVFRWGGNGVSAEHTAFLNLNKDIVPPFSGSKEMNGEAVAEQIGGQTFIDGFAMVAAGDPAAAADLAQAFERHYPSIEGRIEDVHKWVKVDQDWQATRKRIADRFGYNKFKGLCPVIPNHAIMIMTVLYSSDNFDNAMCIVNTSGWGTSSNSGNVACLLGIMHGLDAFEGKYDWRGPIADQVLISSADGGYAINNAARIATDIVTAGRHYTDQNPLLPPKDGAQFHFTLPGSIQGFQAAKVGTLAAGWAKVRVVQDLNEKFRWRPGLSVHIGGLEMGTSNLDAIEITTPTFLPPNVHRLGPYELLAAPLVYPGQTIEAIVRGDDENTGYMRGRLVIRAYSPEDELQSFYSEPMVIFLDESVRLTWPLTPNFLSGWPIQAIGVSIYNEDPVGRLLDGKIWLDKVCWGGSPSLTLLPMDESVGRREFYKRSFISSADVFDMTADRFIVAQDVGQGLVTYGTRDWSDYRVVFRGFRINIGGPCGVAVRCMGLKRWWAVMFWYPASGNVWNAYPGLKRIVLGKNLDGDIYDGDSRPFDWQLDTPYDIDIRVKGLKYRVKIDDDITLRYNDGPSLPLFDYRAGGVGIVVETGSVFVDSIEIS